MNPVRETVQKSAWFERGEREDSLDPRSEIVVPIHSPRPPRSPRLNSAPSVRLDLCSFVSICG
jgi:hypothetical protein